MNTVKVLIVDDEPDVEALVRQRFRKQVRQGEYHFIYARDGEEALARLREDSAIEVVLTDINMPGMDGLTLLARIQESNRLLQPVIVSAYGDLPNIRTAMNRGACDFLTKPIDFDDFEVTLAKTAQQTRARREAARNREQLTLLQRELSIAAGIQRSFLPEAAALAGRIEFELFATMRPARSVGGDFYDFFLTDDGRLGLAVGDVSGKGMSAALFMTVSRTVLRTVALHGGPPGECLREANRYLARDNHSGLFVTVFYALLDLQTGEVQTANAAHPPAFRVGAGGGASPLLPATGLPLGFLEEANYETERATLRPGDALVFFTDGVTEARDTAGGFFGTERLQARLAETAGRSAEAVVRGVVEAVQAFAGDAPQADDVTVMAARYLGNRP